MAEGYASCPLGLTDHDRDIEKCPNLPLGLKTTQPVGTEPGGSVFTGEGWFQSCCKQCATLPLPLLPAVPPRAEMLGVL